MCGETGGFAELEDVSFAAAFTRAMEWVGAGSRLDIRDLA
jgi:hypothetical protein